MQQGNAPLPAPGQQGASLIVCLLMLLAVAMLGASAAQIAVQEEKASRANIDRQLALQEAEAALRDAEADIGASPRSSLFGIDDAENFVAGCGRGLSNPRLGLCQPSAPGAVPAWKLVAAAGAAVPYGHFSGRTGSAAAAARPPAYLIEWLPQGQRHPQRGQGQAAYAYRVTAIGFGRKETTQVVLQTLVRKQGDRLKRAGWREVLNWEAMRDED
ncbi:MAG TPA: PilX N-terminal domain-containing pilus assembly protein [Noviherbaspirillum sp.]|uniref:pilus assembly PilX family protein n=1 Tax=Noviherbaspirillum sp. TaxID=1926288 RepID=UPI002D5C8CDF|nr:PilX N-terminal domain-containing pilus assembly protein [Noviherbaspirillum sp.]HYD97189.1 PilX N-terminal domain-containing pilus assembly protein [Noviherbaspirillum sp.]